MCAPKGVQPHSPPFAAMSTVLYIEHRGRVSVWALVLALAVTGAVASTAPVVTTEGGAVLGVSRADGVDAFLGMPYAAPPTGELRWQAPHPAAAWNGTRNATQFGASCPQFSEVNASSRAAWAVERARALREDGVRLPDAPDAHPQSEDCLFVNVFRPTAARNAAQNATALPVMVFLHGGDLTFGSSVDFDMGFLAQNASVVAVTLNYRLGVLGWLATKELSSVDPSGASGNYGLMDIQAALGWVQRNIGNFSGDSSRVTVFGQSSGGTAVFALLASPASKGLFQRAMSLSGSPNITMSLTRGEAANAGVAAAVNCSGAGNATAAGVVGCLRNASVASLLAATPPSWGAPLAAGFGLPTQADGLHLAGIVLVDGRVVVAPLLEALSSSPPIIDVPLIVSSMAQEVDLNPAQLVYNLSAPQFYDFLGSSYKAAGFASPDALVATVKNDYAAYVVTSPQLAYDSIVSDTGSVCGNLEVARTAALGFSSPVYAGYVTAAPASPFPAVNPNYPAQFAFHGFDLAAGAHQWDFLSDVSSAPPYQPQLADELFGATLRAHWQNFARDGELPAAGGWLNATAGSWPVQMTVGVTSLQTISEEGLKSVACDHWQRNGFGPSFWWSD